MAIRQLLHDQPVDGLLFRVAGDVDWRLMDIPVGQSAGCRASSSACRPTRVSPPSCRTRDALASWRSSTSSGLVIDASGCSPRRASPRTPTAPQGGLHRGSRASRHPGQAASSSRRCAASSTTTAAPPPSACCGSSRGAHGHRLHRRLPGSRRLRSRGRARPGHPGRPLGRQLRRHGVRPAPDSRR